MHEIALIAVLLSVLGAEGVKDHPEILPNKPAELIIPHFHKCFRTCIRVRPTPSIIEGIQKVMMNCHIPKEFVEIQRRNLGRNSQLQEKMRFTAYMKDPQDYWCIVSWESVLKTNIMKSFNIDCNYQCTLSNEDGGNN